MEPSAPRERELESDQTVEQTMAALEALADEDWNLACQQMMALYPIANDRLMHHVCDGIELWFNHKGLPTELTDQLGRLIGEASDPALKRHYEEWFVLAQAG